MSATLTVDPKKYSRSEEHTSELQPRQYLVCRLLLVKSRELDQDSKRHRRARPRRPPGRRQAVSAIWTGVARHAAFLQLSFFYQRPPQRAHHLFPAEVLLV